jgi:glycosyltransferase involved in cell wall biosynthesis
MIKYSIITVCLNSESTIKRCLDSVFIQKFRDFEHVIIDALSTDRTLEIIDEYDVSVCISEKDNGIYDAMNKGVALSKGKYILFLNSDDELLADFLLECESELGDADFLSTSINLIFPDKMTAWYAKEKSSFGFVWRMPIPHAGLIVKKSVFNEIGGFDLSLKTSSDFDFVVKLLKGNYRGVYTIKNLLNFYMGGVSQNYNSISENHKVRLKHFNNYIFIYLAYLLDNLWYLKSKFL